MKNILIDTNAYTSLLRGDERVLDSLGRAEIVYISVFVMAVTFDGHFRKIPGLRLWDGA
jgi:tRNA(fMet)-specific endonuclease VapC